jgi:hypothetical protein
LREEVADVYVLTRPDVLDTDGLVHPASNGCDVCLDYLGGRGVQPEQDAEQSLYIHGPIQFGEGQIRPTDRRICYFPHVLKRGLDNEVCHALWIRDCEAKAR